MQRAVDLYDRMTEAIQQHHLKVSLPMAGSTMLRGYQRAASGRGGRQATHVYRMNRSTCATSRSHRQARRQADDIVSVLQSRPGERAIARDGAAIGVREARHLVGHTLTLDDPRAGRG